MQNVTVRMSYRIVSDLSWGAAMENSSSSSPRLNFVGSFSSSSSSSFLISLLDWLCRNVDFHCPRRFSSSSFIFISSSLPYPGRFFFLGSFRSSLLCCALSSWSDLWGHRPIVCPAPAGRPSVRPVL